MATYATWYCVKCELFVPRNRLCGTCQRPPGSQYSREARKDSDSLEYGVAKIPQWRLPDPQSR